MQQIAFLGLGIMGSGMANKLLRAGHPLTVWNRDPQACRSLAEKGAGVAPSPTACVRDAEVVMYSLSNDQAVWEVLTQPEGILAGVRAGQTAMDMSTVSPETSRREFAAYAERTLPQHLVPAGPVRFVTVPPLRSARTTTYVGYVRLDRSPREGP